MTQVRGMGQVQAVQKSALETRMESRLSYAEKAEEHVWTAIVVHLLSDDSARDALAGRSVLFDMESAIGVEFGCYRCEEALEPRLIGKRCRGLKP
jgi:hypothetical protein